MNYGFAQDILSKSISIYKELTDEEKDRCRWPLAVGRWVELGRDVRH
jgi:hypothetical protein